jgi:hypothetical protein
MHQYLHGIPSSNLEKLESKLFLPKPTMQIADVSPFCWQTVKRKISTSPLPLELIRHSSYISSALPEIFPSTLQIFPCLLAFIFAFFLSFFFYFTY